MLFQILIFLVIAVGIYGGAHYFLYFSLIRFFAVISPATKVLLLGALVFLVVSYFLSSLLAHLREGIITRTFYFLSSTWLGVLTNLVLACLLIWLVIGLAGIFSLHFNRQLIASVMFMLALAYSAYGMWNAFNPKVKNITVKINNLPEAWRGKTAVQLSDIHLGHIHRTAFMAKLVQKTNDLQPDIVFITGDLFDGMDGNLEPLVQPLGGLKAPRGIFFVTGNHETYLGVDKAFAALQKTAVKVLKNEVTDVQGLKIIGISYPERGAASNELGVLDSLKDKFSGQPNILLYHSPINIEQVAQSGVNLQLAGHTHHGQLFPFNFITRIVYKGYDYGLRQLGNFSIYTSDGAGTWGPPMRTGNTPEIVKITLQ